MSETEKALSVAVQELPAEAVSPARKAMVAAEEAVFITSSTRTRQYCFNEILEAACARHRLAPAFDLRRPSAWAQMRCITGDLDLPLVVVGLKIGFQFLQASF